MKRVGKRGENK